MIPIHRLCHIPGPKHGAIQALLGKILPLSFLVFWAQQCSAFLQLWSQGSFLVDVMGAGVPGHESWSSGRRGCTQHSPVLSCQLEPRPKAAISRKNRWGRGVHAGHAAADRTVGLGGSMCCA